MTSPWMLLLFVAALWIPSSLCLGYRSDNADEADFLIGAILPLTKPGCKEVNPEGKSSSSSFKRPTSVIRNGHFFSGSMKSRSGSRVEDSGSFLDMISYYNFVRIEIQSFLKFLRIKVSDGSGSPFGSNSPDDRGRMFLTIFFAS